ncbi:EAL domain-containing protein [Glacieibacterium megasporae]|uniref:EAL domain-containing protein n=1 Tax=Glacieibacterium megasporae TaxID=2835787 RepID=UPI003F70E27F
MPAQSKHALPVPCAGCRDGAGLDFEIAMAFQPIVDVMTGRPYAYEALVRGPAGESAASVLAQVSCETLYAFDQRCRVVAIETAAALGLIGTGARLSINFLPNAVYSPASCIRLTLTTAAAVGFPLDRLTFEFTENEEMVDPEHVIGIVAAYKQMGFGTAIDDFGTGYSGLALLGKLETDTVKLDMALVQGLDANLRRRTIVDAIVKMCSALGVTVVAEGVETEGELTALRALGVRYVQGYYFARPGFKSLPPITPALF